jgi:hypothetical protein
MKLSGFYRAHIETGYLTCAGWMTSSWYLVLVTLVLALWRIQEDDLTTKQEVPTYEHLRALAVKECKSAQKVRAVAFYKSFQEIAPLSLNGYIHIWDAETFKQVCHSILELCCSRFLICFKINVNLAVIYSIILQTLCTENDHRK